MKVLNQNLLHEENKKLRRLQLMIDLTIQTLYQSEQITLGEGLQYIRGARNYALHLFPEKGEAFDLIYKPRLIRALKERGVFSQSRN
jgi:hypothetical protein